LKTAASFVLASLKGSPYDSKVRIAISLAAAVPDDRFEHPVISASARTIPRLSH
jgi:hypothetical protein